MNTPIDRLDSSLSFFLKNIIRSKINTTGVCVNLIKGIFNLLNKYGKERREGFIINVFNDDERSICLLEILF